MATKRRVLEMVHEFLTTRSHSTAAEVTSTASTLSGLMISGDL